MQSKKILSSLIALFLFLLSLASWWNIELLPKDTSSKQIVTFVIPKGTGISQIAADLKKSGLIKDPLAFKILVKINGLAGKIQAGSFKLSPSMDLFTIAKKLTQGTFDIWVTIPEGLRKEEIADKLNAVLGINKEEFITYSKEGYLFPDTYLIPKNYTYLDIINLMDKNFRGKVNLSVVPEGLTKEQVIILASIIERETIHEEDRSLVAGILLKRFTSGWPLDVDAGIQYALGYDETAKTWWRKNLTAGDLKVDSLYNTRKYLGFPPAPICNPGLSSINAALNPKDSSYWFYLSDKEGFIHYAKTLDEHNQNVSRYLMK